MNWPGILEENEGQLLGQPVHKMSFGIRGEQFKYFEQHSWRPMLSLNAKVLLKWPGTLEELRTASGTDDAYMSPPPLGSI